MTLQFGDLLAIGGIFLGSSLVVVGSMLVGLKSELRALRTEARSGVHNPRGAIRGEPQDLRTEFRLLHCNLDALTQALLASGLIRTPQTDITESDAPPSAS